MNETNAQLPTAEFMATCSSSAVPFGLKLLVVKESSLDVPGVFLSYVAFLSDPTAVLKQAWIEATIKNVDIFRTYWRCGL